MSQLREYRLGRANEQDVDGVHRAPISQGVTGDNVREIALTWALVGVVATDATDPKVPGYALALEGYGLELSVAGTDVNTLIAVAFDKSANYVHMTPGKYIEVPEKFSRIFIKLSANLPLSGNTFNLNVFQTKEAKTLGYVAATASQSGTALHLTTVYQGTGAAVAIAAVRQGRSYSRLRNQGPGDIYLGDTAADAVAGQGALLSGGNKEDWPTTAAVYATIPVGTTVTVTEFYT